MKRVLFLILIGALLLVSCKDTTKIEKEIAKIDIQLKVSRFDFEFAETTVADLPNLKGKYPFLFPNQYPDSVWVNKLTDTIQLELLREVKKSFPDFTNEENRLTLLFQHMKYYFPEIKAPKIVTLTNDVSYNQRVVLVDSLLLIGLDNYLGSDHHFYERIPRYIAKDLDKSYLISDVAEAYTNKIVAPTKDRTFLAQLIYYGKKLYLKDKFMPDASDAVKLGFSDEEIEWVQTNEDPIWRNFIEQEYLYKTDRELARRFLDPAPFSKFGLEEIDNESPGKVGRYVGWQIVRSFMKRNDVTTQQLLGVSAEEIFKKANYKPQK